VEPVTQLAAVDEFAFEHRAYVRAIAFVSRLELRQRLCAEVEVAERQPAFACDERASTAPASRPAAARTRLARQRDGFDTRGQISQAGSTISDPGIDVSSMPER